MRTEANICVVVVNYFNEEEVAGFVTDCLLAQEGVLLNVIIVDNGSWDSSKLTSLRSDKITVLNPGKNLGYLHAFLFAWEQIRSAFSEVPAFIVLSNSDIEFAGKHVFKDMVQYHSRTDFACIGPSVFSTLQNIEQNPFASQRISRRRLKTINFFQSAYPLYLIYQGLSLLKNKLRSGKKVLQSSGTAREVYAIHGSFMIFSAKFMHEEAAKLTKAPFLFGEELYVAEVARKSGYRSYFDNRLSVFHREHATTRIFKSRSMVRLLHESTSRILKEFY